MPGIILKGDDFVGIASEERRAILDAERQADAIGVLPDDPEKRALIVDRLRQRLASANRGWDFRADETVVRVDEFGVARIIPKSEAVGWMPGLPAHRGTHDRTSRNARPGRQRPLREKVAFNDPGEIRPVSPRVAAERFYFRIREALERTGTIPQALMVELYEQGWKLGQPVPLHKVDEWCRRFVTESNRRTNGR